MMIRFCRHLMLVLSLSLPCCGADFFALLKLFNSPTCTTSAATGAVVCTVPGVAKIAAGACRACVRARGHCIQSATRRPCLPTWLPLYTAPLLFMCFSCLSAPLCFTPTGPNHTGFPYLPDELNGLFNQLLVASGQVPVSSARAEHPELAQPTYKVCVTWRGFG